jgi:hypothetical protein
MGEESENEVEIDESLRRNEPGEFNEKYAVALSPDAAYIYYLGLRMEIDIQRWFYEPCTSYFLSQKAKSIKLNNYRPNDHRKRLNQILRNTENYSMGNTSLQKAETNVLISLYIGLSQSKWNKEEIQEIFDFDVKTVGYTERTILSEVQTEQQISVPS